MGLEALSLCHCMPPNAGWAKRGNAPMQRSDELSKYSRILQAIVCEMYPSLESFSEPFLV